MQVAYHAIQRFGRRVEYAPDIHAAILQLYRDSRPASVEDCREFSAAVREGCLYYRAGYKNNYRPGITELLIVVQQNLIVTIRTRYECTTYINRDLK